MTVTPTPAKPSAPAASPAQPTKVAAPPAPVVAKSATDDIESLVNRAYNRPLTQEEGAFLASVREHIEADPALELSEFDRRWLVELAGR